MGTNYFIRINICEECERYDEIHVCKLSAGWDPALQGYPSGIWHDEFLEESGPEIRTLADWVSTIQAFDCCVFNEYGEKQDLGEFLLRLHAQLEGASIMHMEYIREKYPSLASTCWIDDEGYFFDSRYFR